MAAVVVKVGPVRGPGGHANGSKGMTNSLVLIRGKIKECVMEKKTPEANKALSL